jgi:hypothetical protein
LVPIVLGRSTEEVKAITNGALQNIVSISEQRKKDHAEAIVDKSY